MENLDGSLLTWIIGTLGTVIGLLLGGLVYFVKRLVHSTDSLTMTVNRLEIIVDGQKVTCFEKHTSLNKSVTGICSDIDTLFKRLNINDKDIAEIKGQLKAE